MKEFVSEYSAYNEKEEKKKEYSRMSAKNANQIEYFHRKWWWSLWIGIQQSRYGFIEHFVFCLFYK